MTQSDPWGWTLFHQSKAYQLSDAEAELVLRQPHTDELAAVFITSGGQALSLSRDVDWSLMYGPLDGRRISPNPKGPPAP